MDIFVEREAFGPPHPYGKINGKRLIRFTLRPPIQSPFLNSSVGLCPFPPSCDNMNYVVLL